ncbi:TraB/GumN family protein [Phenylobacterium sp.]|uniref:TraB/GumN family protein n=1 Tax=Phenylobacterium sp. TaxID=1871053 RepID=UPI0035AD8B39
MTLRRFSAALVAVALLACAGPAAAKPPVWIVRDKDSELVLFGSIHVLQADLDWRPARLDQALKTADDLWFELPIDADSQAETARLAVAHGYLPQDQSLTAMLSPKGRTRLAKACAKYGLSPPLIDRLEPWYAEVALSTAQFRAEGAKADTGVEQTLSATAPQSAQRRAFETPAQQIAMFDGASRAAQIKSLEETLSDIEADRSDLTGLIRAWMAADVKALEKDVLRPMRDTAPEIYERLVVQRNAAWTATLDARLKGEGHTVVVVGVGHLIGPGGLPARLRALGYSVEGP